MILAVLFANSDGNILIERYFPLPLVAEISSPSRCLMRSTHSDGAYLTGRLLELTGSMGSPRRRGSTGAPSW